MQAKRFVKAGDGFIEVAGVAKGSAFGVVLQGELFRRGAAWFGAEQILEEVHGFPQKKYSTVGRP
jgi:hypothetical protein